MLRCWQVIAAVVCVPIVALWWTVEPLLLLAGQDPDVSALASTYLRVLSIGAYPLFLFEVAKKYLQAMSIVLPVTCIMSVTLLFDAVMTYVLIWPMGLGFIGSPLAMTLSNYLLALLSALYIMYAASACSACDSKQQREDGEVMTLVVDPMQAWGGWDLPAAVEGPEV